MHQECDQQHPDPGLRKGPRGSGTVPRLTEAPSRSPGHTTQYGTSRWRHRVYLLDIKLYEHHGGPLNSKIGGGENRKKVRFIITKSNKSIFFPKSGGGGGRPQPPGSGPDDEYIHVYCILSFTFEGLFTVFTNYDNSTCAKKITLKSSGEENSSKIDLFSIASQLSYETIMRYEIIRQ